MPDVYDDGYVAGGVGSLGGSTVINQPNTSYNKVAPYTGGDQGTIDPYANAFKSALSDAYSSTVNSKWAQSEAITEPTIKTPVNFALRYIKNWNPNIGFDATDPELEQKYGEDQGFWIRGINRFLKTGATAAVSFAETAESMFDPLMGENPTTSKDISIANSWLRNLDSEELPNFQTYWQKEHPNASYFDPTHFTSWMDNVGNVTQNLGYTIGAIGAAALIDVPLALISAPLGEAPLIAESAALAKQGETIFSAIGKLSRIVTGSAEEYNNYKNLISQGESAIAALDKSAKIVKNFNTARYLTGVGISAWGESVAEANNSYLDTKADLQKGYTDAFGNYNGDDETTARIEQTSKDVANAVVGPNFAFLAVSNMIGLGSILRPASAAVKATEEALAKEVSMSVNPLNINSFDIVANQTKGIKGIFNRFATPTSIVRDNIREAAEEGYQFVVSDTYKNYYERKFNENSAKETFSLGESFNNSLSNLFGTLEGQQNMLLGFLSGAIQHVGKSAINNFRGIKSGSALAADIQEKLRTGGTVTGLFNVARNEAITATDINIEMQKALRTGDVFEYKNLQHQQLFNFVSSGVAANKFDLRLDQLNALKNLSKENFETLFNLDLNSQNQNNVNDYIDSVINKAKDIKKDIDKVNTVFGNNPFSRRKDTNNYDSFESYKTELANAIVQQKDFLNRSKQIRSTIFDAIPNASVDHIIALSDTEGVADTVKRFEKKIADLSNSEELAKGNTELVEGYRKEREFLEEHTEALKSNLINFNPDLYLQSITSLYNYFSNGERVEGQSSLNELDVYGVYNNSIDLHRLNVNTERIRRYYKEMTGKEGFKNFKEDFVRRLGDFTDRVRIDENGKMQILTDQELEDEGKAPAEEAPVNESKDFINNNLKVATIEEGEAKIDEGDKDLIANLLDDGEVAQEGEDTTADKIRKGITPITDEMKETAKARMAKEFEDAKSVEEQQTVKAETNKEQNKGKTKAEVRAERLKKSADEKGVNIVDDTEDNSDINDIMENDSKSKQSSSKTKTQNQTEPTQTVQPEQAPTEIVSNPLVRFWNNLKFKFSPLKTLNRVFSFNNDEVKYKSNLDRLVLSNMSPEKLDKNLVSKMTIEVVKSTKGTDPNVRKLMVYYENKVKKFYDNLYRAGYQVDANLMVGDTQIGILQPPTSLQFKRGTEFFTLDKLADASEYAAVTLNPANTFEDFKRDFKAYETAYNQALEGFKSGEMLHVNNEKLLSIFKPVISYGSVDITNDVNKSTAISELKYKGKGDAILSFPVEYNEQKGIYERTKTPTILNEADLTDEEIVDALAHASDNMDRIQSFDVRYIYLMRMPDGTFNNQSIIVARPANESEVNMDGYIAQLKSALANPDSESYFEINRQLGDAVYVANKTTKTGLRGTNARFSLQRGNNKKSNVIVLSIFNKQLNYNKRIEFTPNEINGLNDVNDLIALTNSKIKDAEVTDRWLREKIKINLTPESFKKNIANDTDIDLESLKDSLKLSVTSKVFSDPNITLMPSNGEQYVPFKPNARPSKTKAPAAKATNSVQDNPPAQSSVKITPSAPSAIISTPTQTVITNSVPKVESKSSVRNEKGDIETGKAGLTVKMTTGKPKTEGSEEIRVIPQVSRPSLTESQPISPEAQGYVDRIQSGEERAVVLKGVPSGTVVQVDIALNRNNKASNTNHALQDTMARRQAEYVEPTVVNKSERLARSLYLINLPDKHLHPIEYEGKNYDYGWASQIQNALRTGLYVDLIRSGELSEDRLKAIIASVQWDTENEESNAKAIEKNFNSILFKANDEGATFSTEALSLMKPTEPSFQNVSNYFLGSGRLQDAIDKGYINDEDLKRVLEATIAHDVTNRDIKEKLLKEVKERISKGKARKAVVKEAIITQEAKKSAIIEELHAQPIYQENKPEATITPIEDVTPKIDTPEQVAPLVVEEEKSLSALDPNTNINVVSNFDDGQSFYLLDNDGNVIMNNDESSVDGSYDTFAEAQQALDAINEKNGFKKEAALTIEQPTIAEPTVEQPSIEEPTIEQPTVEEPIVEQPTVEQPSIENPSAFKIGDKVSVKGENGIITEIDEDGFAVVRDTEGNRVGSTFLKNLKAPVVEVEKQQAVTEEAEREYVSEDRRKKDAAKRSMIEKVTERMQKIMPSINFEVAYFKAPWKGRIKDGAVQVNMNTATLDTPIHEFLHPFVLALRMSNFDLFTNLIDELKYGNNGSLTNYIEEVKNDPNYKSLTDYEIEEEGLVRYLADDIQTVFDEYGNINKVVMEERKTSFLANVYKWFVEKLNQLWTGEINGKAGNKSGTINTMQRVSYNKKTGQLTGFKPGAPEKTYSFRIKNLIENKEETTKKNISDETIKEIIDIANERSENSVEIPISSLTTLQAVKKVERGEAVSMSVADFPKTFKLKDLTDFLVAQEKISIDLTAEQSVINKMTAYQNDTHKEAEEILETVKKRLKGFTDEGERRIANAQVVPTQANEIKRILRDYDGVEAVSEYIRQGIDGINQAYRMMRYIQEDLDNDRAARTGSGGFEQGQLTEQDINGLNRDLSEVRTLLGFYDDVSELYKYYSDEFDPEERRRFEKVFAKPELRKKTMAGIATELQAKWLYPYLSDAQKNIPKEKQLTYEQFKRNLRFVDKDATSMTYWLGATINSRDPLTAILAVAVKDKLNDHHIEELDKLNNIRVIFDNWQKRTGTKNTIGAIEQYYKDNYLREAKIWETTTMPVNDKAKIGDILTRNGQEVRIDEIDNGFAKVSGYVNRWAFHEENYMDLYDDDFRKFKEKLAQPSTEEEWNQYNKRIADWVNANNPQFSKKYANPNYNRVANDEYFRLLYDTYRDGNAKYGDRQLKYGIVPQAYRQNSLKEKAQSLLKGTQDLGNTLSKKDSYTLDNAVQGGINAANYVFDADTFLFQKDKNLDGSYYRGVKSPFTHLIDQDHLDLRLNESVFGFYSAANTFSSLREVQSNVENLKMLVEGNPLLNVQARQVAEVDKDGKNVFDRFISKIQSKEKKNDKINNQLVEFINDVFYGEDEFQANVKVGKVNINLNKAGRNLGFLTALTNMAGNVFAGVSNVTIGNLMSFGEAVGGKYYGVKDWGKAVKDYTLSTGQFLADSTRPVKSKITQLAVLYDAIQGEFRDKYGKNITGNVARRYASGDTFFIINHVAEHQIQLTGMLALMNATKVQLKGGGEVSLFDAYEKNKNGFYKMRDDALWTNEDENQFTKTLHGISKDLNGNYAAFDKGTIQRHWWGKIALQYRKYMYPAWRSRFASERVDYERGTVIEGYYRTFIKSLYKDIQDYKFNIFKIAQSQYGVLKGNGLTPEQSYAHRKTMFDLGIVALTSFIAIALTNMEGDDDDADKWAKNALMLQMLRLRSDMSQFNITLGPEIYRQVQNPSASLNTLKSWGDFLLQLGSPTETYSQNSGSHDEGDSKLGSKFTKIIPLYRQYLRHLKPEEMVKYYNLINKNVDKSDDADNEDDKK